VVSQYIQNFSASTDWTMTHSQTNLVHTCKV